MRAHLGLARRPDGRPCREAGEESPGSTGIRCRLTAGGGDPRDSATENKPPAQGPLGTPRARAKRCGKSAPRLWQQGRQGKPHREQDRIGTAVPARVQRHSRLAVRVGRERRVARRVAEEWSSRATSARTEPGLQAVWLSFSRARSDRSVTLRLITTLLSRGFLTGLQQVSRLCRCFRFRLARSPSNPTRHFPPRCPAHS